MLQEFCLEGELCVLTIWLKGEEKKVIFLMEENATGIDFPLARKDNRGINEM